jgi:hypothetical protein
MSSSTCYGEKNYVPLLSVGEKKQQVISVIGYKGISDHIGRIWGT